MTPNLSSPLEYEGRWFRWIHTLAFEGINTIVRGSEIEDLPVSWILSSFSSFRYHVSRFSLSAEAVSKNPR